MVQGEPIVTPLPLNSSLCIEVYGDGYSGPCGLGKKCLGLLMEGKKPESREPSMEPGLEVAEPCSQRGRQSSFRCLMGRLCSHLHFLGSPVASFLGAALNQTEPAWVSVFLCW